MVSLQEAITYIQYYRRQGYSDNQIYQGLIQQGYTQDLIANAFNSVSGQVNENVPSITQEKKSNKMLFIIVGLVVLIGILGGLLFLFSGNSGPDVPIVTTTSKRTTSTFYSKTTTGMTTTSIDRSEYATANQEEINFKFKFKFCDFVDVQNDLLCYENPYEDFERDYSIYVFFKPLLTAQRVGTDYKIGFLQHREIIGPDGEIVDSMSENNAIDYDSIVDSDGKYSIKAYNKIETNQSLALGEYVIKLYIEDKYTGEKNTLIKEFELI